MSSFRAVQHWHNITLDYKVKSLMMSYFLYVDNFLRIHYCSHSSILISGYKHIKMSTILQIVLHDPVCSQALGVTRCLLNCAIRTNLYNIVSLTGSKVTEGNVTASNVSMVIQLLTLILGQTSILSCSDIVTAALFLWPLFNVNKCSYTCWMCSGDSSVIPASVLIIHL